MFYYGGLDLTYLLLVMPALLLPKHPLNPRAMQPSPSK